MPRCCRVIEIQWGGMRKSTTAKRSILIAGHKTSVSLEDEFWIALKDIAAERGVSLSDLITTIDGSRKHANLSSAIRLFVLAHFRRAASPLARPDRPEVGG